MNYIALKMLIGDKLKYISLVAGLTFAALLVTQQAAIFTGYAQQTGAWVRDSAVADLWVMDEQVEFTDDIKPMLDTALTRVRGIEGVQWAVPMYKGYLNARLPDGTRQNVRVVGIDDATLVGGPPEMIQGELANLRRDRAMIMNVADGADALALKRGGMDRPLKVGDRIAVNDHDVEIVGSYSATREFFWEPVLYTTFSRAVFMAPRERRTLMYILVKLRPGVEPAAVQDAVRQTTGLKALTNQQFETETMWWILQKTGILINFGITIALGFVIGVLVAGQTLYTFVLENLRHFAALKAMGASHATLVRMVVVQVLAAGLVGWGIGVGGACVTGLAFGKIGLAFAMPWQVLVLGGLAILICCVSAGVLSLHKVFATDPAIVFKA